jgi:hypothetical protein
LNKNNSAQIVVPSANSNKGDIQELKDLINTRYFLAHTINPDPFGRKAYFDIGTGKILYLDVNSNSFHLPQLNLG